MYWKFLTKISGGSPGALFALIFLTYAVPTIILVNLLNAAGHAMFGH